MSAHTPGPWLIREGDEWTHDVVTHHGENTEGEPMYWNVASANGRRDEVDANLHLIAAAPDLLEALQLILPMAKGYAALQAIGSNDAYCEQASAAIAKAGGAA